MPCRSHFTTSLFCAQFVQGAANFVVLVNARQTLTIKCEPSEAEELRGKLTETIESFAEQDRDTLNALVKENTNRRL